MSEDDDLLAYAERILTANRQLIEENERLTEQLEALDQIMRAAVEHTPLDRNPDVVAVLHGALRALEADRPGLAVGAIQGAVLMLGGEL